MAAIDPDEDHMGAALAEARRAGEAGEVPVGAIAIVAGRVVARAGNAPIATGDPTAHAEIRALRAAAQAAGNYRLEGVSLYVTLEPCPMCVGAMIHARVRRLVFGAPDPKSGAAGSVFDLAEAPQHNHRMVVRGGVLAAPCADLLRTFFRVRRGPGADACA